MSVIISCHRSPPQEKQKMGFNIAVGQLMIGKVPRENNNPLEENGLIFKKKEKTAAFRQSTNPKELLNHFPFFVVVVFPLDP